VGDSGNVKLPTKSNLKVAMVLEIYQLRDSNGRKFGWERYAIMDTCRERFLEWEDLPDLDYGDEEINDELRDREGSIILTKRRAELVVENIREYDKVLLARWYESAKE